MSSTEERNAKDDLALGKAYGVQEKTPVWGYSDREATLNNSEEE